MGRLIRLALLVLAFGGVPSPAHAARVRAAYAYDYMPASHVDSLADRGFTRVLVHWISDSLDAAGAARLAAWHARGVARGLEVVPEWVFQARARLTALSGGRRYAPDDGRSSAEVPCPLDSLYWRSALIGRAGEFLAVAPLAELALDLELYWGPRHHLDGGACRCDACVREYLEGTPPAARPTDPRRLTGMAGFQEARLTRLLTGLLREFAARHPGVRLAVLDLDYDAYPHRALARALARAGVPTADYCERSYATGGAPLRGARARLDALGLRGTPLYGGIWLGRFTPRDLVPAMASIDAVADGTWAFTTYSLWQDPARLTGPYTLLGDVSHYWDAFARANPEP